MEMDKINKLKQEVEEYLTKEYCCEFKKECIDGVRVRCSEYEAKLYLILRFAEQKEKKIEELKDEVRNLKILVSSLVYEINQIWDINEMNDDLRMCAERIDREVQLSEMAEDNRMVISALGFAIVPPKPKLDVKM